MIAERTKVWGAMLAVSTVWGSTWLAIKLGLESVPPFLSAGVRFAVAAVLLYVILRVRGQSIPFTRDARRVYLALGVLSFSIPFALVYWGQQFLPSSLGSILFAAYPFWVALFQYFMLGEERMNPYKVGGIVLGFIGVAVIFWGDVAVDNPMVLVGMSTIVVSTILQAYVLILIKKEGESISPIAMNFVGMLVGTVLLLALSAVAESGLPVRWTPTAIGSILYLSVIGSVLTFVSYYWLLKRIDAVYLSLTSFVNPIVAVLLGAVVLGERLAPIVYAGSGLVLVGILVANAKALYEKLRSAR